MICEVVASHEAGYGVSAYPAVSEFLVIGRFGKLLSFLLLYCRRLSLLITRQIHGWSAPWRCVPR